MLWAARLNESEARQIDLFGLLDRFRSGVFDEPSIAVRRVLQSGEPYERELKFADRDQTLELRIALATDRNGNGSNGNGEVRYCDCDELIIGGERTPMPHFHNCEYVRQRNSLIKEAERIATGQCGNADPYGWTKVFVAAMDKLAEPLLNNGAKG